MARQPKSESKLTEAADKATAMLQELQSRLTRDPAPAPNIAVREETPEDLDQQLREYFVESGKVSGTPIPSQIRERVIDAVAQRILEGWERGDRRELGALENQVIDRVAARILERMTK